jgi:SAM-dependent methyltransferase
MSGTHIVPTPEDLQKLYQDKYDDVAKHGWRVRMRHRFGYIDADHYYEAFLDRLVKDGCSWADVGGGTEICLGNRRLAAGLVKRCKHLLGIDPSDNIDKNPWVYERAKCLVEEYRGETSFDLVTLRMVAEHIQDPDSVVAALARLARPGAKVLIYTPNRWSLGSIFASITPFWFHPHAARLLYGRKADDTFPTHYRMNTRRCLRAVFERGGFTEAAFVCLANCTTFQRFRLACLIELSLWWLLRQIGLTYPFNHLIVVYEKE